MGMGVQRKNQPNSKVKGGIGAGGLDFCSRRWGNRDEVWKVKDFLPDLVSLRCWGHLSGDGKMFRYMGLGKHRQE